MNKNLNDGICFGHILSTIGLDARPKKIEILREARGWEHGSNHVLVLVWFG